MKSVQCTSNSGFIWTLERIGPRRGRARLVLAQFCVSIIVVFHRTKVKLQLC